MPDPAALDALAAAEALPREAAEKIQAVARRLAGDLLAARVDAAPLVVGLCGAQGSGKSTIAKFLTLELEDAGKRVAVLSLDDLYLTREQRRELAARVHPLFATRGVPGTHDVALGLKVLDGLARRTPGAATLIPRFDKAADTRALPSSEDMVVGAADVVIFEGWCVGAVPQDDAALAEPVNELERTRDPDGTWRRHVNAELAGPYRELFDRIGLLVLLEAPGFERVLAWRTEQEAKLRAKAVSGGSRVMSDAEIAVFVQHYERLTRHILAEMPGRCNVRIALDADRRVTGYETRAP
jgi:D-glycerate 3-kinase